MRTDRFQTGYLDERAGIFVELHPRLYDFCVVEYHQGTLGQIVRQRSERVLAHRSVTVHQQFGLIPFGLGVFCDTLLGQFVVEVFNLDVFGFFHWD